VALDKIDVAEGMDQGLNVGGTVITLGGRPLLLIPNMPQDAVLVPETSANRRSPSSTWPTGSVLDAGCGTGATALFLAGRGCKVTGSDFLDLPIHQAQRKAADRGVPATFLVKTPRP